MTRKSGINGKPAECAVNRDQQHKLFLKGRRLNYVKYHFSSEDEDRELTIRFSKLEVTDDLDKSLFSRVKRTLLKQIEECQRGEGGGGKYRYLF